MYVWELVLLACTAQPPDKGVVPVPDSPGAESPADSPVHSYPPPGEAPNFIIIKTDDQRADTLWVMPVLQQELVAKGVHYERARTTVPLCCPERASFMAGGLYPWRAGVVRNEAPAGGASAFEDRRSMPRLLQEAGYRTGHFGKYLFDYELMAPYVPPGWTHFAAVASASAIDDFELAVGSSEAEATTGTLESRTGYEADELVADTMSFLDQYGSERFFIQLAVTTPHLPASPKPEDEGTLSWFLPRSPSWNEEDMSDKPARMQLIDPLNVIELADIDTLAQRQLESLVSFDRALIPLFARLEELNLSDNTVIVYTSDNGYLWGEHRLTEKSYAYEESVRVPLVIRAPGLAPGTSQELVATNLDVAATIGWLAQVPIPTDGRPLPDLPGAPPLAGRRLPMQNWSPPAWAGVIDGDWKYVWWADGGHELYNLADDPYELENVYLEAPTEVDLSSFRETILGFAGVDADPVPSQLWEVGGPVYVQMEARFGVEPYRWSVEDGRFPLGVSMSSSGLISGVPTEGGSFEVLAGVRDDSVSDYSGRAPFAVTQLSITVGAPAPLQVVWVERSDQRVRILVRAVGPTPVRARASGDPGMDHLVHRVDRVVEGLAVLELEARKEATAWDVGIGGRVVAQGWIPALPAGHR